MVPTTSTYFNDEQRGLLGGSSWEPFEYYHSGTTMEEIKPVSTSRWASLILLELLKLNVRTRWGRPILSSHLYKY